MGPGLEPEPPKRILLCHGCGLTGENCGVKSLRKPGPLRWRPQILLTRGSKAFLLRWSHHGPSRRDGGWGGIRYPWEELPALGPASASHKIFSFLPRIPQGLFLDSVDEQQRMESWEAVFVLGNTSLPHSSRRAPSSCHPKLLLSKTSKGFPICYPSPNMKNKFLHHWNESSTRCGSNAMNT